MTEAYEPAMSAIGAERARAHLVQAAQQFPGAWRLLDQFRAARGRDLPAWPDWCYLPLSAAYAVVSSGRPAAGQPLGPLEIAAATGILGALATWRLTQGVYRFDPTLYAAVLDTPLDGAVPVDVLYQLPEWCVYVETPTLTCAGRPLHGAYAHLEWDANTGREELRLVLDREGGLLAVALHLGPWPLAEALDRFVREAERQSGIAIRDGGGERQDLIAAVAPILSLVLYLCTANADLDPSGRRPPHPEPTRTKRGPRWFPPDQPTRWEVGVRLGAALRRAETAAASETADHQGTHASPRAHIRRAHWHGFWRGPRSAAAGERTFALKWLPPIPINVGELDELATTIRPVK